MSAEIAEPSGGVDIDTELLTSLAERFAGAVVACLPDGTILLWNTAAERLYGYSAASAVGQSISMLAPDDRQPELREVFERVIGGESIHSRETHRRRADGATIDLSLSAFPVHDSHNAVIAVLELAHESAPHRQLETHEYLAAIVKNSDDAIVAKSLDGTIIFWNDAATRMYGYEADEAIGQSIDIVLVQDDAHRAEEVDIRRQIELGEQIDQRDTVRRRQDGAHIDVSLSISPVRDNTGKIIGAAGFARNVSQLRKAFDAMSTIAAIVENSDDAIVAKSLDGTIIFWNDAASQMYGYEADEALGQPIDIILIQDDVHRNEETQMRQDIAQGKRIDHHETVRRRKNGEHIPVSLSLSPVTDGTGKIVGAAGFARDISERERLRTNQYLAAIIDNSDDAIVSMDLDGRIQTWNEAATRMYGFTAGEALARDIDIILVQDDAHRTEETEMRRNIARGERINHYETQRRRKDGEMIEVSLSRSPVRNESGTDIIAAADIARDISHRKELERDRSRVTALLEGFISYTAHDFKTPIQRSRMSAQQAKKLLGGADVDPKVVQLLDEIAANSHWVNKRTEGLLRASTLKARRRRLGMISAKAAFDESYEILRSVDQFVRKADISSSELPEIAADEELLGFLFQNLLQNAAKYGRRGIQVVVQVTAERRDGAWEFAVIDNGMGIDDELKVQIFEPFVRGSHKRVPGSGIGLDLCKRIVEWHGGRIWVESQVNQGSTFRFTIPDEVGDD